MLWAPQTEFNSPSLHKGGGRNQISTDVNIITAPYKNITLAFYFQLCVKHVRHPSSYLRQAVYEAVDVGRSCSFFYLRHGGNAAVVSIGDVFSQGAVEQHGLLGYDAYLGSQPVDVQLFCVYIVQQLEEKMIAVSFIEGAAGLDAENME